MRDSGWHSFKWIVDNSEESSRPLECLGIVFFFFVFNTSFMNNCFTFYNSIQSYDLQILASISLLKLDCSTILILITSKSVFYCFSRLINIISPSFDFWQLMQPCIDTLMWFVASEYIHHVCLGIKVKLISKQTK